MAEPMTIRAVVFEDRGWWVAQCLESDLCSSAKDRKELIRKLTAQLRLQITLDLSKGRKPFDSLPRAPQKFWDMYSAGSATEEVPIRGSWLGLLFRAWHWRPGAQAKLILATA
jgi:hypothetical protein